MTAKMIFAKTVFNVIAIAEMYVVNLKKLRLYNFNNNLIKNINHISIKI